MKDLQLANTRIRQVGIDTLTNAPILHAVSRLGDDTGAVGAGRVRKSGQLRVFPGTNVGFHRVHPGGMHADDNLPGTRRQIGGIAHLQNFGVAKLLDANCFHGADTFDMPRRLGN